VKYAIPSRAIKDIARCLLVIDKYRSVIYHYNEGNLDTRDLLQIVTFLKEPFRSLPKRL
jgi:hypothetical protein